MKETIPTKKGLKMVSKIEHKFQSEMFVPWCAIHNNIGWMIASEKGLETSDGVMCNAKKVEHMQVLSDEATAIVKRLYNAGVEEFIRAWYKRCPMLDSMWFVYINVEEVKKEEV